MADLIQFELEDFNNNVVSYNNHIDELRNLESQLESCIVNLGSDWQSSSYDAFLDKIENAWKPDMESLIEGLVKLSNALSKVASEYEPINSEFVSVVKNLESRLSST